MSIFSKKYQRTENSLFKSLSIFRGSADAELIEFDEDFSVFRIYTFDEGPIGELIVPRQKRLGQHRRLIIRELEEVFG